MREYYYLTGLKDSPYSLTIADALHLGATGRTSLCVYAYVDNTVYMELATDPNEPKVVRDSGFFLLLSPTTIASFEKSLSGASLRFDHSLSELNNASVPANQAFIDERYNGSIPFGGPFNPEPECPYNVKLYDDSPYIYPDFAEIPAPVFKFADLLCWTDDLERLAKQGRIKRRADGQATSRNPDPDRQHYPPHLEALTLAWHRFWKNADPNDRDTCPKKQDVVDWLEDKGLSQKNADSGATIIKPQWAIDKGW
ncbi:hypothetical protein Q4485_09700 [Granulosicoccaceae sp. 1_MG-2023]|nr:hypothetical protein [Granulosicoccaceae sp. 1_MG-2023]